jgi:hypothetical protein
MATLFLNRLSANGSVGKGIGQEVLKGTGPAQELAGPGSGVSVMAVGYFTFPSRHA